MRAGKKVYVKTSEQMHFVLKNNKTYTNVKAVQVSKKSNYIEKRQKSKINSICIKRKQKEKIST